MRYIRRCGLGAEFLAHLKRNNKSEKYMVVVALSRMAYAMGVVYS